MRKSTVDITARNTAEVARDQTGVQLVCFALALALAMLAFRIFSVW